MGIFEERQSELEKVFRYGQSGEWSPMYYRPNLRIHTTRVYWITREITKYLDSINKNIYSSEIAKELALYHDDSELIMWDILSMKKEKFTNSQQDNFEKESISAIKKLSEKYSTLSQHNYEKLLLMDQEKQSIEYFIVAYADKLDANMEVCHEIFAGNHTFTCDLKSFWIDSTPYNYTREKIQKLLKKLSDIFKENLESKIPLFTTRELLDVKNVCFHGAPFNEKNIRYKTWYTLYDSWKELHFLYWTYREKQYLYKQREFKK